MENKTFIDIKFICIDGKDVYLSKSHLGKYEYCIRSSVEPDDLNIDIVQILQPSTNIAFILHQLTNKICDIENYLKAVKFSYEYLPRTVLDALDKKLSYFITSEIAYNDNKDNMMKIIKAATDFSPYCYYKKRLISFLSSRKNNLCKAYKGLGCLALELMNNDIKAVANWLTVNDHNNEDYYQVLNTALQLLTNNKYKMCRKLFNTVMHSLVKVNNETLIHKVIIVLYSQNNIH